MPFAVVEIGTRLMATVLIAALIWMVGYNLGGGR